MPMPRETGSQWLPTDNSSLTNHRYDLITEKIISSVGKAKSGLGSPNYFADLQALGLFIQLPLLLLGFMFILPLLFLKHVVGYNIQVFYGDPPTGWWKRRDPMDKYRVDYSKYGMEAPKRRTYTKPTQEEMEEMANYINGIIAQEQRS